MRSGLVLVRMRSSRSWRSGLGNLPLAWFFSLSPEMVSELSPRLMRVYFLFGWVSVSQVSKFTTYCPE